MTSSLQLEFSIGAEAKMSKDDDDDDVCEPESNKPRGEQMCVCVRVFSIIKVGVSASCH